MAQEERLIAPYQVHSIYVDNKLAVSAAAVNLKDAKRAASEFFRDVLEELVRIEAQASRASAPAASQRSVQNGGKNGISNGTSSSNGTGNGSATNSSNRNGTAAAASEQSKVTRPLVASDASDDDDDYYSSGGESDWDPNEAKQGGAAGLTQSTPSSSTAALSATELMKQPYDLQSESGASDDAKFRAVIRSLFTPTDDLCAGINHLRGSLKFRGVAEKIVVPNVKASIRINRLREGLFEVRVDVNDVIHFMEARMTKPDAINAAIDGILATLNTIRSEWVQLLHFLHVKCLSDTFLDAYNAMKLTGITSVRCMLLIEVPRCYQLLMCASWFLTDQTDDRSASLYRSTQRKKRDGSVRIIGWRSLCDSSRRERGVPRHWAHGSRGAPSGGLSDG